MNITKRQRFEALAYYFGWQGGTIHQLEQETGCVDLLERELIITNEYSKSSGGFSCVRTCDLVHRLEIAKEFKGDWSYWSSVIRGYFATGCLGGVEFSKRFNPE